MSDGRAFQDGYPEDVAHCYGCGRLNETGIRLRSYWDGEETVARYTPRPEHTAIPGYVYGGLVASLIDCHGTGSAAAAGSRAAGLDPATEQMIERAIDKLLQNRTAIIIAHRLGTLHRTNDVMILEDGCIVEYGSREQLAADPSTRFHTLLRTGMEEVLV